MSLKQGVLKYQQSAKTTKTTSAKSRATSSPDIKAKSADSSRAAKSAMNATSAMNAAHTMNATVQKSKASAAEKITVAKAVTNRTAKVKVQKNEELSPLEQFEQEMEMELRLDTVEAIEDVEIEIEVDEEDEAEVPIKAEQELQAEIAKEVAADEKHTSSLVKADFSPVNTPREKLIIEYASLIKYIAQKIAARLPANIELDDLISSGVIGLMDAIEKYDSTRDNKFKTYAEFRIRGAILDELRAQDWVPRSVREKAKQLERIYSKVEQEKGRHATDEEVCEHLGISQDEFHDLLNTVRNVSLLSFDDISSFSNADKKAIHGYGESSGRVGTPFGEITSGNVKKLISQAIVELPEKQRLVLSLYYYEDLNLKEIGRVLDVTESRVSQLHTQAVLKLKAKLRNHMDELGATLG